jgi:hypothetical protein
MIHSLRAMVVYRGNTVRSRIARPETVVRYLTQVSNLADYQVWYTLGGCPYRVTGEGFLALYEAGRLPTPPTLKQETTLCLTPAL